MWSLIDLNVWGDVRSVYWTPAFHLKFCKNIYTSRQLILPQVSSQVLNSVVLNFRRELWKTSKHHVSVQLHKSSTAVDSCCLSKWTFLSLVWHLYFLPGIFVFPCLSCVRGGTSTLAHKCTNTNIPLALWEFSSHIPAVFSQGLTWNIWRKMTGATDSHVQPLSSVHVWKQLNCFHRIDKSPTENLLR